MQPKYIVIILNTLFTILLLTVPFFYPRVSFFFYLLLYLTLALSFNIMYGFTGYIPFGHAAFYGSGGYTAAILALKFNLFMPISVVMGSLSAILVALVMTPTLRLRGVYFAISTMAANLAIQALVINLPVEITGGAQGLGIPKQYDPIASYYMMVIITVLCILTTYFIRYSKLGLKLLSIKNDPEAAEMIGINVTRYRTIAWVVSAFFGGLVGGVDVWHTSIIDPYTGFSLLITCKTIIMTLLGGAGTVLGPILGSLLLYFFDEIVWSVFPLLYIVIYGVLLTLVVLFIPEGIIEVLRRKVQILKPVLK